MGSRENPREVIEMSERTALEIALDLDAASCSSFVTLEAAEALRQQHAEIERLTAERDEAIAADQEIERLRSQVARLRAVIVGLVGEDDLHGLAVMAEFLERLDHDDARKSLDVVMALLEIRPEGERSRK
jgi:hypothetical protein